jgi:crotonobetainyl-CoA:carnitine CoA-transferase CaiB-like acyl-CoA transferase
MKPLAGIRVLDLSQYIAGPYCTQILATFGAEVVKIESPGGDDARSWPPIKDGFSGYFANFNGGKKSLALDLKDAAGRAYLDRLIARADILVHNFTGRTRAKLNLDYDYVCSLNERLIYCNITGFGADGPYQDRKGFDTVFQAVAGVTNLTGEQGREPVKAGVPVGDISAGIYAALSIMAAIRNRDVNGKGECIDYAIVDGLLTFLSVSMAFYSFSGKTPERLGSGHVGRVPSQVFQCRDGKYVHLSINDGQWPLLCDILDLPDWRDDDFYKYNNNRITVREEIVGRLREKIGALDCAAFAGACMKKGVPCGEVNAIEDIEADPQIQWRKSIETVCYGDVTMRYANYPARYANIDTGLSRVIPQIGEHNEEIGRSWLNEG